MRQLSSFFLAMGQKHDTVSRPVQQRFVKIPVAVLRCFWSGAMQTVLDGVLGSTIQGTRCQHFLIWSLFFSADVLGVFAIFAASVVEKTRGLLVWQWRVLWPELRSGMMVDG